MGMLKLWGKDKDGNKGFVFSHVKTIYYNWASKILLSTKLDEMDKLIDEKIAKAMMANQQVNDANKVPTSALAYAMQQSITKNAGDISQLTSDLRRTTDINGSLLTFALSCGQGITYFRTNENTTDSPFSYSVGLIYRRNQDFVVIGYNVESGAIKINQNSGSSKWGGWKSIITSSDFVTEKITSEEIAINANSNVWVNVTITKSGYKPICISGYYIPEGGSINIYSLTMENTKITAALFNPTSVQYKGTIYFHILYMRN